MTWEWYGKAATSAQGKAAATIAINAIAPAGTNLKSRIQPQLVWVGSSVSDIRQRMGCCGYHRRHSCQWFAESECI
ncbi:hypothetical protein [Stenomitos frigidus]|uniref:hypothetical protein n=1 Tax=Stenomitos frigidus TaxID=1886765 RepID=UPI0030DB8DF3